ncbi:hypothetical protein [Pontibacter sp. H249]|uniref:hypothetical protein n=1 Tax=Pontibacter sp. H249 TaxID=3133420 RepID=UPI0030C5E932
MHRIKISYKTLITIYIGLVTLLGFYLLLNSKFLMSYTSVSELPLAFLLRFGIFWFVSFVLALVFFVAHIHMHQYTLSDAEIAQSAKVGTFAFIGGVCVAALSGILIITLA